jgi:hypothetical protein
MLCQAPVPVDGLPLQRRSCDTPRAMDLPTTLAIMAALVAFGLFAAWRGARPPDMRRGPRLTPWRFLMLLSAALAILMLVHVVNLLGFQTGR